MDRVQARVRRLFDEAAELAPAERAAFLDRECVGDPAARERVDLLLKSLDEAGEFLAPSHSVPAPGNRVWEISGATPPQETAGTRIGPYRLLQQIGEGGFGVVFLAEQQTPVVRRVALKVIKLGMDTRQVIARFEAERQALAMMDHPNIARVLDAGATETGRPYFVMELVQGDPITTFCDQSHLSTTERLDLFQQVCHAVQHAHQKGIIHRDIKPSNVLVTVSDGRPIPKVIDFGIAKATLARLTEKTLFTEHRALIGTPEYMSPEQAGMSGVDVDTRSDIYSLGVLLYELLTGTTPFSARELREGAFDEIQRIIREVEPPKPSTRISTLTSTIASVAAHRHTEPARLVKAVRGDLDCIVMKCIEKDRTRRYETANGLAADVLRHLTGDVVTAAPPSAAYRVRKFVRRHRVGAGASAAIALILVAGVVGTTSGYIKAARRAESESRAKMSAQVSRARADEQAELARSEAERAVRAEQAVKARAEELEQVSGFQARMLSQIDAAGAGEGLFQDIRERFGAALDASRVPEPDRAARVERFEKDLGGVNATDTAIRIIDSTILKPAIRALDEEFRDRPLVDASLRQTLAEVYETLGRYDDAMPLQESALATRRQVLGNEHPDTLTSTHNMGALLYRRYRFAEAEPYLRDAVEKRRRVLGEDHSATLLSINLLGVLLENQGRLAEAEPFLRDTLEKGRRVLGEDHPGTITYIHNMGSLLQGQGRFAEAEPYFREAVERSRRVLGEENPDTLASIHALGQVLRDQEKLDEAEPYLREVVEKSRRVLGDDHPHTLTFLSNLGFLLGQQGKLREAETCFEELVERGRRVLAKDEPDMLTWIQNLGYLLQQQDRLTEAEPYCREALEKSRQVLGEEDAQTLARIGNLGTLLQAQGKLPEAELCYREELEKSRRVLGDDHPDTLRTLNNMGVLLLDQEKAAEAEPLFRQALAGFERKEGKHRWHTAIPRLGLGRALKGLGRFSESETELIESERVLSLAQSVPVGKHDQCLEALVALYEAWDKSEPGKGYDAMAAQWRARLDAKSQQPPTGR